jgi:ABC-type branched-subunit amino acid transport system ATPase component
MAAAPHVLLLDEPASGLDAIASEELSSLVRTQTTEQGLAVLLVEHDMDMVFKISDRIVVLNFGRVIASGTPDEIRNSEAVTEAYLGSGQFSQVTEAEGDVVSLREDLR